MRASKKSTTALVPQEVVENRILLIKGKKVILDRDLAELYGVKPIRLREQVKRNTQIPGTNSAQIPGTNSGDGSLNY